MNPLVLVAYAVFSLLLIGGGMLYDETSFDFGLLVFDSLVLFLSLAVFLGFLRKRLSTPIQILVGMIAGALAGWALNAAGRGEFVTDYLGIFGDLFLLSLKMVIVPLVFVSVLLGVAALGDIRKLGTVGVKTLIYFISATSVAIVIGLIGVNLIRPGVGQEDLITQLESASEPDPATDAEVIAEESKLSTGKAIQEVVLPQFLQSPIRTDDVGVPILAIITFAILLGAALMVDATASAPLIKVFEAIDKAMITLVMWIMILAPLGVFALMAEAISVLGIGYVQQLALYGLTVILGLVLHFCVLVFFAVPVLGGIPAMRYLRGMAPALQVAFTTSSSSATLPVSMKCAIDRVGIDKEIVQFVVPIGTTVNMDGTALYTSVAALFVAQVYGLEMTLADQLMIFLTANVVSIGTAGIPGASLALMTIIFAAVGIPVEGIALVVGLDRLLDMCRTTVNVVGDSVCAAIVSRSENKRAAASTA